MAAEAVKKTNGFAIAVTDDEILTAQKEFKKETGIFCETSSASVYAAYKKIVEEDKFSASEKVLLLITGNGLKEIFT